MPSDTKLEDTIILLDTSRSMLRRDFTPNRLNVACQGIASFIQKKFQIDPMDRIALIGFGDITHKLCSLTNDEEEIIKSFEKINISGKGKLYDAIALALQILVGELRKLGGKVPRIVIISDDKLKHDLNRLNKIVKIAKGLGVYIDACQLGKTQDYKESTIKRIAKMTGGEFGFFNNTRALLNAGRGFASKKEFADNIDHFGTQKNKNTAPLISEMALSLRRPTVMEIRMMMSGKHRGEDKCQICHSVKAALTSSDFFSEGRYCPSCDRAMHLSCAAMWAKKSEFKTNVFRCPFCFFLLKLPKSAEKLIESNINKLKTQKSKVINNQGGVKKTNMIQIAENYINDIDASCSYCHNIFLGDFQVFKCGNCEAYYHEPCIKKMYGEIKACRFCGAEIDFEM